MTRLLLIAAVCCVQAEEWTRFRGPNGSGVSQGTGFPTLFNKDKNVAWRTSVRPGKIVARTYQSSHLSDGVGGWKTLHAVSRP